MRFNNVPLFRNASIRRLYAYLPKYKASIALALIAMVGAGAGSSLIALLLGKLTDIGFYNQEPWIIIGAPVGLIFVSALNGGSMLASNYLLTKVSQSVMMELRMQLFHKILRWPAATYQWNPTGVVISKFVNEANFALGSATKNCIILVRDTCQVISLSVILVWHNWLLTIVALVIAPAIVYLLRWISKRMKSVMTSSQQNIATLFVRVKESYESERLVKISNAYQFEFDRFRRVNDEIRQLALRITRVSSLGTPATQVIGMLGVAIVLVVALIQTQKGMLTLGEFVTFLAAMLLVLQPLKRLAGLNSSFVGMSVAAESLFATLDEAEEPDTGKIVLGRLQGRVAFEHVSLRYPNTEKDAVHDFNLVVSPGESIALVGFSGSGKTSLVNMIPRFWNPTSGRILMDGTDAQDVMLASLRDNIAIVSQDVVLFDDTIRANIAYGMPEASEDAVEAAVKAAALDDFIASLPDGLDTQVGEAGSRLSGGQKQRISIARALLKNAPILILDEATSALDSESEAKIQAALSRLMKDRTTFIVAHRLSTIRNASRIVVMSEGGIQEIGTHDELLAKQGAYAKLVAMQGLSGTHAGHGAQKSAEDQEAH